MESIRTTCPYCGVGCGVKATPGVAGEPHNLKIEGDETHPANFGRLCVKGAALAETIGLNDRLLFPEIRSGGKTVRANWGEALDTVADGFRRIMAEHGPGAVAFYVSGQLLTEDYYVANKLMKGYIGTANIDTNSRLCMSSAVAGHKRAFGEDLVPVTYEDLELADLVVLVGSNTAWCHPVLYQRIASAKEARPEMQVVVIDPRRTASCDLADLHLPLKGGSDVWLFNGLLGYLERQGLGDGAFVEAHTQGCDEALAAARDSAGRPEAVAKACGLPLGTLEAFYQLFAARKRVITAFSQGVNQSSAGTDKVNAIINCHLFTGRIGKPGAGPFSVTGQPNAMGGREVGGLATMLAAHMELGNAGQRDTVREFWGSPVIADRPGLKAVELFDAIHDGQVKAVWIMATNPVVSLPDADRVRAALAKCELVVVSDVTGSTDTAAHAQVLLPALAWGEKSGTVTNSDRTLSRQRAFLPAPGEAKADWWIVAEVARRMGFAGFDYQDAHEVFDEHARLSAFRNDGTRCFDIGGLAGLDARAYDALAPVQWPVPAPGSSTARLFEDARFYHPDRKARFIPTPPRAPANLPDEDYPFVLNTGRVRDQWHTMTRTGKSPKLSSHLSEPYVEMHSYDAMLSGVQDGALVRVATAWGAMVARLRCTANQTRRSIFVPIHWNDQFASDGRVGKLVNPVVDPISGEPEFKHTPARVEPFLVDWHGFILSRRPLKLHSTAFWVRIQGEAFLRYELAGRGEPPQPAIWNRLLGDSGAEGGDWLEYSDDTARSYRAAAIHDNRIDACVFVSARPDLPSRAWLSGLFAKDRLDELDRIGLLVGQPANPEADTGPTVCACYGIGRNMILQAIRKDGLNTVQQLGACLKAGTNCGSCVPELKSLIAFAATAET